MIKCFATACEWDKLSLLLLSRVSQLSQSMIMKQVSAPKPHPIEVSCKNIFSMKIQVRIEYKCKNFSIYSIQNMKRCFSLSVQYIYVLVSYPGSLPTKSLGTRLNAYLPQQIPTHHYNLPHSLFSRWYWDIIWCWRGHHQHWENRPWVVEGCAKAGWILWTLSCKLCRTGLVELVNCVQ